MSIAAPMPKPEQRIYRPRPYYTTGQIADAFRISASVVARACDSGLIPFWRVPGSPHRRISHESLKAWVRSQPDLGWILERIEWAEKLDARSNTPALPT